MDSPAPRGRPVIVGNWKMHGLESDVLEAVATGEVARAAAGKVRVIICPPATLLDRAARRVAATGVEIGAQDCHPEPAGAFTGDVSAAMLAEAGAGVVILGHSERRSGHGESDELVAAKATAASTAGLEPVICVGETEQQRAGGETAGVISAQVASSIPDVLEGRRFCVAYEPVWAIGTGNTPTLDQIEAVHAQIRSLLLRRFSHGAGVPILYGGSVKPANAVAILGAPEVGGALVGAASLTARQFIPIVAGASAAASRTKRN